MHLAELVFGKSPSRRVARLRNAPAHVHWRRIRAREGKPVRAYLADADHRVQTAGGELHARAGRDIIIEDDDGEHAVVRRDIFEQTYEPVSGGLYRKRSDVMLRYFKLAHPALIETLEGDQRAEAGGWIIEGVDGELWPVAREKALERYEQL